MVQKQCNFTAKLIKNQGNWQITSSLSQPHIRPAESGGRKELRHVSGSGAPLPAEKKQKILLVCRMQQGTPALSQAVRLKARQQAGEPTFCANTFAAYFPKGYNHGTDGEIRSPDAGRASAQAKNGWNYKR
jgi:hypothetical protein